MRKAFRRLVGALTAACGVGLASTAVAQVTPRAVPAEPGKSPGTPYNLIKPPPKVTNDRPAGTAPTTPVALGEPYVTTGVVIVSESIAPPAPVAVNTAAIKIAIERACGSKVRDVQVLHQGGNTVVLQYSAKTSAEASEIWLRIQALPELQAYKLDVRVRLQM